MNESTGRDGLPYFWLGVEAERDPEYELWQKAQEYRNNTLASHIWVWEQRLDAAVCVRSAPMTEEKRKPFAVVFNTAFYPVRRIRRGLTQREEPVMCECGAAMTCIAHEGQPIADQNKRTYECPKCNEQTILFEDVWT